MFNASFRSLHQTSTNNNNLLREEGFEMNSYNEKSVDFVSDIIEDTQQDSICNDTTNYSDTNQEDNVNFNSEKHCAVWTTNSTSILLKLYEDKLEMLETPKKKTRIWIAISECLKQYDIKMTPDQVRWKINALTKKYKQCIDNGNHEKFKYFKEMDKVYSQFNVDGDANIIAELLQSKKNGFNNRFRLGLTRKSCSNEIQESKAMIQLRKIRLASRIESDRSQSKIHLEKQWLEYLRKEEEHKKSRDEMFERSLKVKEKELELQRKSLRIKESFEYRKMQMWERKHETLLSIEREKFEMLKKMLSLNK